MNNLLRVKLSSIFELFTGEADFDEYIFYHTLLKDYYVYDKKQIWDFLDNTTCKKIGRNDK